MVDQKRVEKKLAALLVDKSTSSKAGSTEYKRKERDLRKFKRQYPSQYRGRFSNLVQAIAAFDRDITTKFQQDIDAFNASFSSKKKR